MASGSTASCRPRGSRATLSIRRRLQPHVGGAGVGKLPGMTCSLTSKDITIVSGGICRKFRVRAITMEKKETSYGETEATGYFRRAA